MYSAVLIDNGTEFSNPVKLEKLGNKHQVLNIFYTHSYSSYEKGKLEQVHTLIREVFHKGESLKGVTQNMVSVLTDHINSIPRESLNGKTLFEVCESIYGIEFLNKLGIHKIDKNKVCRNKKMFE